MNYILFTYIPDAIWWVCSFITKSLIFIIYWFFYSIALIIYYIFYAIFLLQYSIRIVIVTVLGIMFYIISYIFNLIYIGLTYVMIPFVWLYKMIMIPFALFFHYFILPLINLSYYILFYIIVGLSIYYFIHDSFRSDMNKLMNDLKNEIQQFIKTKMKKTYHDTQDDMAATPDFDAGTILSTFYKKYYETKNSIANWFNKNLNYLIRNMIYTITIISISIFSIIYNPMVQFLLLLIVIISIIIFHPKFKQLMKQNKIMDVIDEYNKEYIPAKYKPYTHAIDTISKMQSTYETKEWQVFSKIEGSLMHGLVLFISKKSDRKQILLIDLWIKSQGWYVRAFIDPHNNTKQDGETIPLQKYCTIEKKKIPTTLDIYELSTWKYLGNCMLSLTHLKSKLINICDNFGDYHFVDNNCQDFIQDLTIYINGLSTSHTYRLSFFYGFISFLYYNYLQLTGENMLFDYFSAIYNVILFILSTIFLKNIFRHMSIILTKIKKIPNVAEQIINHFDERIFLLRKIAYLMLKLFALNAFLYIIPDSSFTMIMQVLPFSIAAVCKEFYFE